MTNWRVIVRLVLRFFLRLIRDTDGVFTAGVQAICSRLFPARYTVTGQCKKRGVCCHNIGIWMRPESAESKWVLAWVKWWYEFVYHFESKGLDESGHVMVFRCRYLINNRCSIYWRRHFICRQYPITHYFKKPVMLPGCGYRVMNNHRQTKTNKAKA